MQVAIVTGASSGIGFGCATKLTEAGMAVLGTGRDPDRLAELAKAIDDPERVATLAVDLTADDGPRQIVDAAVERWGHIDFLINNAGVGSPKPLHETDDESFGLFPGFDAAGAVPAGARRDPAHAAGFGDHQRHVDLRGGGRPARRRVLRGQGRADGADDAHRVPVRAAGNPVQRRGSRRDADPDGGDTAWRTSGSARSTPR